MSLPIQSAKGKVILVTGANRGIGLATARELQRRGARVIAGVRDSTRMPSISGVTVVQLDTADAASCEAFVARAEREEGRIDGLINNAGILVDRGNGALDLPDDELRRVFEVNLLGPIRLCRLVVPGMLQRRHGRIVNVTSGLASISDMGGGYASYRMSKLALNGFTRILAAELSGDSNVKVNSISPGWTRTDMGGAGASRDANEPAREIADLVSIGDDGSSGGFFYKGEPAEW
jgi:NAD(P)-dependent dehydrogenase (short-subunit alcohol dehydrogenase family)